MRVRVSDYREPCRHPVADVPGPMPHLRRRIDDVSLVRRGHDELSSMKGTFASSYVPFALAMLTVSML
jgi:hypothetical protein